MSKKILLVDDEEGIRTVLGISLADSGYDVLKAGGGAEALRLFRDQKPHIVLTDIKMPGMDGIQVLQKIKEERPETEVIMISGHGDMDLAIQSLKYGATDFITKPINDDILEIALKRANEKIFLKSKMKEYTENLEQLVEEKTRKLLNAERLTGVGQTVAGLAHAIKNVAAGLKGGAFVLEKGIELDNKKYLLEGWEMVKGNLVKIGDMAMDLLNYTKERTPEYQRYNLNEPLREVFLLMVHKAEKSGVILEKNLDDRLAEGWLDPKGIHRCILNLVTNAIDACTDISCSQPRGKVTLRSQKIEGWAVEYQIIDNGCGMDQETREKIFQRFFSTKGSRGTGLGLMITKKIVDEHGGVITCQSERGKGAKFMLRLPEKEHYSKAASRSFKF